MRLSYRTGIVLALACVGCVWAQGPSAGVSFSAAGLSSLNYNSTEYLFSGAPQITQVLLQDAAGITAAGDLTVMATAVDSVHNQLTQTFRWGTARYAYTTSGNRITLTISITNTSASTITAIFLQPLALKLPSRPLEYDGTGDILFHNIGGPTVLSLTSSKSLLAITNDDVSTPLVVSVPFAMDPPADTIFPLQLNTGQSTISDRIPFVDRPIGPGLSDQYQLSLRFGAAGTPLSKIASDVYQGFASANPMRLEWSDRRLIGSLFLATTNTGWPTNPRGWFLDPSVDVLTADGVANFQQRVLDYADHAIAILKTMNAQGVIVWDIEGEQYGDPVTYVGDPRLIGTIAPEMEPIADAFFAKFTQAGLRVGLTVRPQQFVLPTDSAPPEQQEVADPAQLLIEKISYAKNRWGCSLFYIDSNGDPNLPIDANVMAGVQSAYSNDLLIPEQKNFDYYTFSAPYSELRAGVTSTPATVRDTYPNAFSVINIADTSIDARSAELVAAVTNGDIMLFRSWYDDPANRSVLNILEAIPDTTPPTVAITAPTDGSTVSGVITLTADPSDNIGIGGVQFHANSAPVGPEATNYPYIAFLDTTTLTDGPNMLDATVRDFAGNTATTTISVIVSNGASQ
jgi:Bacterial Ig domain